MKFHRKILKLSWGVIIHPSETFDRIKTEKPLSIGLTIWLLTSFLHIIFLSVSAKFFPDFQKINFSQMLLQFLWDFGGVFLSVFFTNFLVIKVYGCKSNYLGLLLCVFFINVVTIIFGSLIILFILFDWTQFLSFLNLYLVWVLILNIIAIKRVYNISGSRAFFIFLLSALICGVIFFAFKLLINLL